MLNIKKIRSNPEKYREGLKSRGDTGDLDSLLKFDNQKRKKITEADQLKSLRNRVSEEIGVLKREGKPSENKIKEMRSVGGKIKELDMEIKQLDEQIRNVLVTLPNIPHELVKIGSCPEENEIIKYWGEKPTFDFPINDHFDLAVSLNILDFWRASKISGTGFPLYMGYGAKLERSMVNFMIDFHTSNHGYKEVFPPFLTTRDSAFGTGQLPKLEEDMYITSGDSLFLIPTSEVPVVNIHRDEIISEDRLPLRYAAYSACFRREAGSYGKETRGLTRVHQFNKVEMVKFTTPETSYEHLETMLSDAEAILQALNLHYRVVSLCSGDLGFAAAKCYDIEVWAPAAEKYLEVSSISNCEDFQARRANIRFRRSSNGKVEFVHTLNGSGVATPRLLIALLETYQTDEGTIIIPEVLQSYTGFSVIKSQK